MPPNDTTAPPCLGEAGGHLRPDTKIQPYAGEAPGFPDLTLTVIPADEGFPCLGRDTELIDAEPGAAPLHVLGITISFTSLSPASERWKAAIVLERDADGRLQEYEAAFEVLTRREQRRLRQAYDHVLKHIARRIGRPTVDAQEHISQLRTAFQTIWAPGKKPPSHPRVIIAMGYEGDLKRAWDRSKKILRGAGTSWTQLTGEWVRD